MSKTFEGTLLGKGLRFGVAVSRFNEFITRKLLEGMQDALLRHGVEEGDIEIAWVPGAFELPLVAKKLAATFNFEVVCITLREDVSVLRNRWTAIAYSAGKIYDDKIYDVEIVDRVGAGDSFTAGFIYGYLTSDVETGIKLGNAYSALKHSIPGDTNWATLQEVENLTKSASLRISR